MKIKIIKIWNTLKDYWWIFSLSVVFIIFGFFHLKKRGNGKYGEKNNDSVIDNVANCIQPATANVMVDNAVIKTKSDVKRQEVEDIRSDPDSKKRKERIVSILKDSI
jgi:hypothetical protein